MNRREFLLASMAGLIASRAVIAAPASQPASEFLTDIPAYDGNVLLARPTDRSITLNVFSRVDAAICVAYGPISGAMQHTPAVAIKAGEPKEIVLDHLQRNAAYRYEILNGRTAHALWPKTGAGTFHTAREAGSSFVFTIQADSHLDDGCRTEIYQTTLANQLADQPDFMIDMGDTSMAGKHPNRESAARQYLAQRYYFGIVGHSLPSFLLLGNHDGEEAKLHGATEAGGLAVWASAMRKRYFTNPQPDAFYTGNAQPHPHAGLLQNYYAWTWGEALFVVLDPYWTSTASRGNGAGWHMSLGKPQYDWLTNTLRSSKAKHKLVFIHQLVGGLDDGGRGGAEAAGCFEWGGHELDGRDTFAANRPGWAMPIHRLLIETGVKVVFHGHDHFFAKQSKDGVLYQLLPQAAHRNFKSDHATEYGYKEGQFLPNSGHLRVTVKPTSIIIDYVRSVPDSLRRGHLRNGDIAATVTI